MADKDQEPQDQEMQDAPAEGQEFEFDGGEYTIRPVRM